MPFTVRVPQAVLGDIIELVLLLYKGHDKNIQLLAGFEGM
jgi:predicted membrane-bound mannosyltransferase